MKPSERPQQSTIFGTVEPAPVQGKAKGYGIRGGYPARPGTGPADETCGTCKNLVNRHKRGRVYRKCSHTETKDQTTDIAKRSPACLLWRASLQRRIDAYLAREMDPATAAAFLAEHGTNPEVQRQIQEDQQLSRGLHAAEFETGE